MGISGEKHNPDTQEERLFIQVRNLTVWGFVFAEGREQLEDLFFNRAREL